MNQIPSAGQSVQDAARQHLPEVVRLALVAFDATLNGIFSLTAIRDAGGQVIDFVVKTANRAVSQSLFKTPEELVGTRLLETFPDKAESGLFATYVRVVETRQPEQTIRCYTATNGLEAWFSISAVCPEADTLVVTFSNITESKQAEQAIQHQADLLQTVLNKAQAAISLHTAVRGQDGRIENFRTLLANEQARTMWGELAESILTKSFFEVATPAQKVEDFPKYVRVVETGEPDFAEFSIGDHSWLRITTKSGDGVVIANVDVTENRRYRQQLESANLELKRSNESLQSFAYIASHDLQEPLRKIQAFGDILNERYAPTIGAEGSTIINRMQSAAERMSLLIKDLLDYSRIASIRESFRPFSLAKLIDDILEDLWHPIHATNARIIINKETGQPLPELTGDRLQLRHLFQNLLSNALKFFRTDSAGQPIPPVIEVSADFVDWHKLPEDLQRELLTNRPYWSICLSDNGIGFDLQYAEQIFQVFQRLNNRQQFTGTGIGLAVVKKVVEQHDGAIRVHSEVGQGASFIVYLPA